jgi:membrane protease YdiL (CAAX protease family)
MTSSIPNSKLIVQSGPSTRSLTIAAWSITLFASLLPTIVVAEIIGAATGWLFWARVGVLAGMVVLSFVIPLLRPLRSFMILLAAIYLLEMAASRATALPFWQAIFGGDNVSFTTNMFGIQIKRVVVALLMIGVLLLLGFSRKQFFLVRGDLRAPVDPVRLRGFPNQDTWMRFGFQWAIYITLGTLAFLFIAGRPSGSALLQALPILPMVLLFAAMNAFSEEMTYRSALLAPLEGVVGPRQALYMTALFFGIGHFYGVPYGIIGMVLASFLGWMLGKAMLETRGFFWAWFIHFLQDVAIFSFMAVGSIVAGGG